MYAFYCFITKKEKKLKMENGKWKVENGKKEIEVDK